MKGIPRRGFQLLAAMAIGLPLNAADRKASPPSRDESLITRSGEDRDLESEVRRRLEARLTDSGKGIHVENRNGNIVLRGSVSIFPEKEMATETAESVRGVREVTNELRVTAEPRTDEEIARDVRWSLRAYPATMALGTTVTVREGVVTLSGTVETVAQKRLAGWVAAGLRGVRGLENQIHVTREQRSDREIVAELRQHFATSPLFNDDEIKVQVRDGVVHLAGRVDSALEKNWARDDAWVAGVWKVNIDRLDLERVPPVLEPAPTSPPTDEDIRQSIIKAFVHDPHVPSVSPEVIVKDSVVTLRGAVPNRRARQAAVQISRATGGVQDVIDELIVRSRKPQSDDEVESAIRAALTTSAALAANEINVQVENGRVELKGKVDSYYEKWVAEDLADRTPGVVALDNQIVVRGTRTVVPASIFYPQRADEGAWVYSPVSPDETKSDAHLADAIRRELAWSPFADAEDIHVEVQDGVATLTGKVDSWSERRAAGENAFQAGARQVINQLQISVRSR